MSAHDPDPQHFGFLVQGLKYQQKIALKTKSELNKKREIIKNLHYKSSSRFSINEQKKLSKILIK